MLTTEQKENRKKLVSALRSGEFNQTTGQLCKNNEYCALGVAAQLIGLRFSDGVYLDPGECPTDADQYAYIQSYYGIDPENDFELYRLNDFDRMTFEQIAQKIEDLPSV